MTAPATSSRRSGRERRACPAAPALRGRRRRAPIGTLTRKIQCQLREIREDPAEQHADRSAAGRYEAEDPHCLRPFGRLGEEGDDDRQRHRLDDGSTETLQRPCADEHLLRRREPAAERGEGEERDPEQEQAPVAEEVAEPARQQEEPAEGEQVRVRDPRQRALAEAEIVPDRGQRDADNRHVEDDHQVAEADDDEGQPAASVGHVLGHRGDLLRRCDLQRSRSPQGVLDIRPATVALIRQSDRPLQGCLDPRLSLATVRSRSEASCYRVARLAPSFSRRWRHGAASSAAGIRCWFARQSPPLSCVSFRLSAPVGVHDVDLAVAVAVADEEDLSPVGRPGRACCRWRRGESDAPREVPLPASVGVHDVHVAHDVDTRPA